MARSESRALLDDQIASLRALRNAAQAAYMGVATLPVDASRGDSVVASTMSELGLLQPVLDELVDETKHLLGATPVTVPLPRPVAAPSACAGASYLLRKIGPLFAGALSKHEWLQLMEQYKGLAALAGEEIDAAIVRVTAEFRKAAVEAEPAKMGDENYIPAKDCGAVGSDESAYVMASTLWREHWQSYKRFRAWLRKNPKVKTRSKGRRFYVHSGDFHRAIGEKSRQAFVAIDAPAEAVDQLLRGAAQRQADLRQQKAAKKPRGK